MDKITIFFAFDPFPNQLDNGSISMPFSPYGNSFVAEIDKDIDRDLATFESILKGHPVLVSPLIETFPIRQKILRVLAAQMLVTKERGHWQRQIKEQAISRLELFKSIVLRLEFENGQNKDATDFRAHKLAADLKEAKRYLKEVGKALSRWELEIWEWSNPYVYDGKLCFRWVEMFEEKADAPPQPAPADPPPTMRATDAKAQAPTDTEKEKPKASLTARQLALYIYYRFEAGERGFFTEGKGATWEKLGNEYGFHQKTIEKAYGSVNNAKSGKYEREKAENPHNLNDHKAIIPMLNDYPAAQRLAQSTLTTIESKM